MNKKLISIIAILSLLVIVFGMQAAAAAPTGQLPNIKILATGGTIAGAGVSSTQTVGYTAAVTPVDAAGIRPDAVAANLPSGNNNKPAGA